MTNLWIVTKYTGTCGEEPNHTHHWEFQGVFDSETKAIAACRSAAYAIGPAVLNEEIPDEFSEWPGMYYPFVEQ